MNRILAALRSGDWLTASRVRAFAIAAATVWVLLLAGDCWSHTRFGVANAAGEPIGRDFVTFWSGARLAIEGKASEAYRINQFLDFERSVTSPNASFRWYGYPPIAMLLTLPLGLVPFLPGFALWTLGGWALLARTLARRMGWAMAAIAVMATPAFFINAFSGQNGAFSAALLAGGILALERRRLVSGLLFGLLCYKPHLGVLIPVALLAGKEWRAVLAAGATTIALVGTSLLVPGWQAWAGFLHHAWIHRLILETVGANWVRMPSVYPAARLMGAANVWAYAAQAISAVAAVLVVAAVWRGPSPLRLKGAVLIVATFLVTPYAWDYDLVVLLFASLWFWDIAEAGGWRSWEKMALALLLAEPLLKLVVPSSLHLPCGPVVLWIALLLFARRAIASDDAVPELTAEPCSDGTAVTPA
jgi:hypothetical protein